ncbi:hypothetical protein FB446DRAFT_274846 [Lentinula raphanica]|nr:hypothetical protein FB446DRAFT_274846 [Lentinula raphanica]
MRLRITPTRTNRMHGVHCILPLLSFLLVFLIAPTIGAPVSPEAELERRADAEAAPVSKDATTSQDATTSLAPGPPTPSPKLPLLKVTADVTIKDAIQGEYGPFPQAKEVKIPSDRKDDPPRRKKLVWEVNADQWQMDVKSAVRRMLELGLGLAVGNPVKSRDHGKAKVETELYIQTWSKGYAPYRKFKYEVKVRGWPGKTGIKHWLGGVILQGEIELAPRYRCNPETCTYKGHPRYNIISGTLDDVSEEKRLVKVENNKVVDDTDGTQNVDDTSHMSSLERPPPAILPGASEVSPATSGQVIEGGAPSGPSVGRTGGPAGGDSRNPKLEGQRDEALDGGKGKGPMV